MVNQSFYPYLSFYLYRNDRAVAWLGFIFRYKPLKYSVIILSYTRLYLWWYVFRIAISVCQVKSAATDIASNREFGCVINDKSQLTTAIHFIFNHEHLINHNWHQNFLLRVESSFKTLTVYSILIAIKLFQSTSHIVTIILQRW